MTVGTISILYYSFIARLLLDTKDSHVLKALVLLVLFSSSLSSSSFILCVRLTTSPPSPQLFLEWSVTCSFESQFLYFVYICCLNMALKLALCYVYVKDHSSILLDQAYKHHHFSSTPPYIVIPNFRIDCSQTNLICWIILFFTLLNCRQTKVIFLIILCFTIVYCSQTKSICWIIFCFKMLYCRQTN